MICSKCSSIIPDDAKHCPFCGALAQEKQPMQSVQPMQAEQPSQPVQPTQEAVQTVPFCHICGLELAAGAEFCPVCGAAAGTKEKTAAFSAIYGTAQTAQPAYTGAAMGADTPDFSDFGDLGGAAAMAVTVPLKKKSRLPLIAGICAGVVVVLAGVVALNRSTFLPMFMGKAGYAAMIEGKGAADALTALDSPVAAAVLESAAESAVRYAVRANGGYLLSGGGISPAAVIAQTRNSMLASYGKDEVEVSLTPSVELTATGRDALFGGESGFDEIVDAVNACKLSAALNAQEDAASLRLTLDEQGAVTDADVIVTKDTFYVEFPFAGEAFKGELSYSEDDAESAGLELDPKQTSRIIKNIGDIYIKHYKSAEFTVESGELTAAGVTAKGQLVTCTMDGERLNALAQEIGEFLAEDEYLSGVITEYVQANGAELTAEQYQDAVRRASAGLFGDNCSVTVKTVVNSACKTLAKSYILVGSDTLSLTYINGKDKGALEASDGSTTVTADITRVNKQDGTINVKAAGGSSFSAKLVYSGVKTQEFCGRKILAGEFRLSFVPPVDFTRGDSPTAAVYAAISKAELTLAQSVEGGALKQRAELRMPQYGAAAIDAVVTARDGAAIEPPANAIDIYEMYGSDEDTLAGAEMMRRISQSADRNGFFAAMIADAAESYAQDLEDSLKPQANLDDILAMKNDIDSLLETAKGLPDYAPDEMTEERQERCDAICSTLEKLAESIDYTMTEERCAELRAEIDAADELLGELIEEINKAQDAKVPISQRGEIDYSDLSVSEISDAFSACEMDYLSIVLVYYGAISEDEELMELYDKASTAHEKASTAYYKMMGEIDRGNWSVPLVNAARKTLKSFDEALAALEKKLPASAV